MQIIFCLIQGNTIDGSRKYQISQTDNKTSKAGNESVTNAGWLSRDANCHPSIGRLIKEKIISLTQEKKQVNPFQYALKLNCQL